MKNEYRMGHKVQYSEVDSEYKMRLDRIVTHFQDLTSLHSCEMEIDGRTMLEVSNAFWVLARLKIRFHKLPEFDDEVEIETWPTFARGVRFGRDYTITKDGVPLVSCTSEWCTLDYDTKRPRRVDSVHYPLTMPHREDRCNAGELFRTVERISEDDYNHSYRSAFIDIDTNHHTNNAAYVRMILNCFSPDDSEDAIEEMQISFLSQTFFGDEIKVYKKKTDYGFYVEGRHDSIAVFNSMIILKK